HCCAAAQVGADDCRALLGIAKRAAAPLRRNNHHRQHPDYQRGMRKERLSGVKVRAGRVAHRHRCRGPLHAAAAKHRADIQRQQDPGGRVLQHCHHPDHPEPVLWRRAAANVYRHLGCLGGRNAVHIQDIGPRGQLVPVADHGEGRRVQPVLPRVRRRGLPLHAAGARAAGDQGLPGRRPDHRVQQPARWPAGRARGRHRALLLDAAAGAERHRQRRHRLPLQRAGLCTGAERCHSRRRVAPVAGQHRPAQL
ncbi:hypothetical protein LPJ61_006251, partial [Coemansia biformis]